MPTQLTCVIQFVADMPAALSPAYSIFQSRRESIEISGKTTTPTSYGVSLSTVVLRL
jgi:hypothetical protein